MHHIIKTDSKQRQRTSVSRTDLQRPAEIMGQVVQTRGSTKGQRWSQSPSSFSVNKIYVKCKIYNEISNYSATMLMFQSYRFIPDPCP